MMRDRRLREPEGFVRWQTHASCSGWDWIRLSRRSRAGSREHAQGPREHVRIIDHQPAANGRHERRDRFHHLDIDTHRWPRKTPAHRSRSISEERAMSQMLDPVTQHHVAAASPSPTSSRVFAKRRSSAHHVIARPARPSRINVFVPVLAHRSRANVARTGGRHADDGHARALRLRAQCRPQPDGCQAREAPLGRPYSRARQKLTADEINPAVVEAMVGVDLRDESKPSPTRSCAPRTS